MAKYAVSQPKKKPTPGGAGAGESRAGGKVNPILESVKSYLAQQWQDPTQQAMLGLTPIGMELGPMRDAQMLEKLFQILRRQRPRQAIVQMATPSGGKMDEAVLEILSQIQGVKDPIMDTIIPMMHSIFPGKRGLMSMVEHIGGVGSPLVGVQRGKPHEILQYLLNVLPKGRPKLP